MATGVDVNKTRIDDVDRIIIRDSLAEPFEKRIVCNFGSGESSLSLALGTLGHKVYNYDNRDIEVYFKLLQESGVKNYFTQIDISTIKKHNLPKQYSIAVFQRVLHYLPYKNTHRLLQLVSDRLSIGGKIYLSFTGVDSAIGYSYEQKDTPIDKRWGSLSEEEGIKFSITEPVCLYRETEVKELVESIKGLVIEKIWVSQFGNIKVVATKVV